MNPQNSVQKEESFIAFLAATAPALLQLIAVLSIGISNVLSLKDFLIFPTYINIANLFTILLTVAFISVYSIWEQKKSALYDDDMYLKGMKDWDKKTLMLLKSLLIWSFILISIFSGISLLNSLLGIWKPYFGYLQWFSYILSLTFISFMIFLFSLLKIREKEFKNMSINYVPRLFDSLRRYGHVTDPDIKLHSLDRGTNRAIVEIQNKFYEVGSNFDGEIKFIKPLNITSDDQSTS